MCARCILIILLIGTANLSLLADDVDSNKRFRFGALLGGSANFHAASFGALAGFPSCCPQYTSGSGLAPTVGVFAEIPLSSSVSHMIRATLSDLGAQLTASESITTIVNNRLTLARIQHSVNATIKGIGIEPDMHFRLGSSLGLYVGLRCEFSLKGEISQKEELVSPEVGTFENGRRIRNEVQGQIFALQPIVASAVGGIRWELPMNRDASVLLIPELAVSFGINTITASEEWRVHGVRLSASIAFQSPRPPATSINTVDAKPLTAELSVLPFDGQNELVGQSILIEESEHIEVQPLLPFIFFDQQSEALPARYATSTEKSIDSFEVAHAIRSNALSSYYGILQIVGKRLRQHTTEAITLQACVDSSEQRSADLAKRRAENISRYLQRVWGIDRGRIRIEMKTATLLSPEADANAEAAQKRRVELAASPLILAPLQYRDTTRSISPRYLRLRPVARGGEKVDRWDIQLTQQNELIKSFTGNNTLPFKLTADLVESPFQLRSDSIAALLIVNGRNGGAASSSLKLATNVMSLSRKRMEGMSDTVLLRTQVLMLKHSLLDSSESMQVTVLKALYDAESTVSITDFSSAYAVNTALLQQRHKFLQNATRLSSPATPRYSNTFPESRLYNRSVEITMRSRR